MRLSARQKAHWRAYVAVLKRKLPTRKPVSVRTLRLTDDAYVYDMGKRFAIHIGNHLTFGGRLDALEHEYAHCLDDFARHGDDYAKQHGESWGCYLSQCHRVVREQADVFQRRKNGKA